MMTDIKIRSGHSCTWEEYKKLADIEYDNGYGAQKVASDLIIVFSDGNYMWRDEYDGAEGWEFAKPFLLPSEQKPISRLVVSESVGRRFDSSQQHQIINNLQIVYELVILLT